MSDLLSRARTVVATPAELYPVPENRDVASLIDHTLLRPQATSKDVKELCAEAIDLGFVSICVNPVFVPLAVEVLSGSDVRIGTVVGFPLGATAIDLKRHEAAELCAVGARDIDMVMNIGAIKGRDFEFAARDVRAVVEACPQGTVIKVIIETAVLSDEEKAAASLLAAESGAHFVKTSTGFSSGGAVASDVAIIRRAVGDSVGVKAAGGIRTLDQVRAMVRAGATRIGTSSGVRIMEEARS